jgi:hypothetical protein
MVLLSDYAKSCGYAVDKEKTSRGCAVRKIETAGDKVIVTVDADEHGMNDQDRRIHFENQLLPLMPEAYNLARWMMKNESDARDAVQDAYLKAFRYFESFMATPAVHGCFGLSAMFVMMLCEPGTRSTKSSRSTKRQLPKFLIRSPLQMFWRSRIQRNCESGRRLRLYLWNSKP